MEPNERRRSQKTLKFSQRVGARTAAAAEHAAFQLASESAAKAQAAVHTC